LLFQTLDEKNECAAVFSDGSLTWNEIPDNLTKTWRYSAFLKDKDISYANLYCGGLTLDEVCPKHLQEKWGHISARLKAFYRSFVEAKVDLHENCFFELVPEQFLLEFCDAKNMITDHIFQNYEKPENYDFLSDLTKLTTDIRYQKVNVDMASFRGRMNEYKTRQFFKKLNNTAPYVDYNIFGTKTGRLSTRKGSFPILTMDKKYRSAVKPNNDWLVELDYNAAELRVLLALAGKEQPKEDIHDWNVKNVYRNLLTREEAKTRIFAWLYNSGSKDFLSNRAYDRGGVKNKYWDGEKVNTIFGRQIDADEFHALNYIIQSTSSDLILRQAIRVHNLLRGKKTRIAFIIHDSIVLDMSEEDQYMIQDIYDTFAKTNLGTFKTSAHAGKNFGDMSKLWIQ
jgi:hypothetical protein